MLKAEFDCRRGCSRKAEPTQLRNEASLNCVSLRSSSIGAIPLIVTRVFQAVGEIDALHVAVVLEIVGVAIVNAARIKAHIRIMSEKKRAAGTDSNVQRDSIVRVAVGVLFSLA